MIKVKYVALSILVACGLTASAAGVASAATTESASTTVGTSEIPRSTFRDDRLKAEATVLNTTTDQVTAAHKAKTFKDLLSKADLTRQQFHDKVKAELTSELEAQGYTQDQITIALQHKEIKALRHEIKSTKR